MEWSTDPCHNMDKPWKHYATWNKPDTEGRICCHLYKMSRIGKSLEQVNRYWLLGARRSGSFGVEVEVFVEWQKYSGIRLWWWLHQNLVTAWKSLQMVIAAMKLKDACSLEEAMTDLDSILKSTDITLPIKVRLVKAMVFPLVMYGCESWTIKKAERRRIDAFELWCWRRLLRVSWTAWRSN